MRFSPLFFSFFLSSFSELFVAQCPLVFLCIPLPFSSSALFLSTSGNDAHVPFLLSAAFFQLSLSSHHERRVVCCSCVGLLLLLCCVLVPLLCLCAITVIAIVLLVPVCVSKKNVMPSPTTNHQQPTGWCSTNSIEMTLLTKSVSGVGADSPASPASDCCASTSWHRSSTARSLP